MKNKPLPKIHNTTNDTDMNEKFWNDRYLTHDTGWDMGQVSPPLKAYIDQLTDKNIKILIPGCGNAYEAAYLLEKGFSNITVIDIAPLLLQDLKNKLGGNSNINIILGDFFHHNSQYDLILEQTFFCALHPSFRNNYVLKMYELLVENGKLAGLLFDKIFEETGPPFGGGKDEYKALFENSFEILTLEPCYNSHEKRQDSELFLIAEKKK